ncbi:fructosamine kinase family protein [Algoriphagus boritolerans]|uniref:Fructosamine-3-kinase n=1 Tax=Algoriphagus boritolerans DSM 17298 = JCM 18970 TaxID=1120964 RepID=A0A1H5Z7T0_9BACT|nr:fructosamine kinase family protein [Algoriphagus boritolerans]SEG32401.1 Fructosamine-3-kinase [Algoriphagus boritolerans DSM 17298 = JCM 18970]
MHEQYELYQQVIFETLGPLAQLNTAVFVAAGNHNQGIKLETTEGPFFLKLNFDHERDILSKEAEGLHLLRKSTFLKIPQTYGFGRINDYNYLLSEFVPSSRQQLDYWEDLGLGLAHLHLTHSKTFGLESDNYIASLHQKNHEYESWSDFFIEQRLEPMLGMAYFDKLIPLDFLKKFQTIYSKIDSIFPKEKPSLVHGDLWSGNVICNQEGKPCLIDPAVYYGHREMDLAFSRLFGGFDTRFYDAYESIIPLEPGFESRIGIYNLYPLLVHLNLFGTAYLPGIEKIIKRFQ